MCDNFFLLLPSLLPVISTSSQHLVYITFLSYFILTNIRIPVLLLLCVIVPFSNSTLVILDSFKSLFYFRVNTLSNICSETTDKKNILLTNSGVILVMCINVDNLSPCVTNQYLIINNIVIFSFWISLSDTRQKQKFRGCVLKWKSTMVFPGCNKKVHSMNTSSSRNTGSNDG